MPQAAGYSDRLSAWAWTIFFADLGAGDTSTLNDFNIGITALPEPATWALIIFGVVAGGMMVVRRIRRVIKV